GGAPRGERGHVRGRRGRLLRRCRRAPRGALALVVDEALGVAGTALGAAAALAAATSPAAAATAAAALASATAAAAAPAGAPPLAAATAAAAAAAGATARGVVFDGQLGQTGAGVDAGAHAGSDAGVPGEGVRDRLARGAVVQRDLVDVRVRVAAGRAVAEDRVEQERQRVRVDRALDRELDLARALVAAIQLGH